MTITTRFGSNLEDESSVQLKLVEILTRTGYTDIDGDTVANKETDFATVTGYLSTHFSSSIIVKLTCQTLEKVDIYYCTLCCSILFSTDSINFILQVMTSSEMPWIDTNRMRNELSSALELWPTGHQFFRVLLRLLDPLNNFEILIIAVYYLSFILFFLWDFTVPFFFYSYFIFFLIGDGTEYILDKRRGGLYWGFKFSSKGRLWGC